MKIINLGYMILSTFVHELMNVRNQFFFFFPFWFCRRMKVVKGFPIILGGGEEERACLETLVFFVDVNRDSHLLVDQVMCTYVHA